MKSDRAIGEVLAPSSWSNGWSSPWSKKDSGGSLGWLSVIQIPNVTVKIHQHIKERSSLSRFFLSMPMLGCWGMLLALHLFLCWTTRIEIIPPQGLRYLISLRSTLEINPCLAHTSQTLYFFASYKRVIELMVTGTFRGMTGNNLARWQGQYEEVGGMRQMTNTNAKSRGTGERKEYRDGYIIILTGFTHSRAWLLLSIPSSAQPKMRFCGCPPPTRSPRMHKRMTC